MAKDRLELAVEAKALEADEDDRKEMLSVASLMESICPQFIDG